MFEKYERYCHTRIQDLSVKSGSCLILDKINLDIHCGQLIALMGPNGAGKSTLLKALLGEVKFSGSLIFENCEGKKVKPTIGYIPQKISIDPDSPMSVENFYDVFLNHDNNLPTQDEEFMNKICQIDRQLKFKKLRELSGGELQRVLLSLSLRPVPNILLMDEPTSGIDQDGIAEFWSIISRIREVYDLVIIIISHDPEQVRKYADKVIILNKKILKFGSPKEILAPKSEILNG